MPRKAGWTLNVRLDPDLERVFRALQHEYAEQVGLLELSSVQTVEVMLRTEAQRLGITVSPTPTTPRARR